MTINLGRAQTPGSNCNEPVIAPTGLVAYSKHIRAQDAPVPLPSLPSSLYQGYNGGPLVRPVRGCPLLVNYAQKNKSTNHLAGPLTIQIFLHLAPIAAPIILGVAAARVQQQPCPPHIAGAAYLLATLALCARTRATFPDFETAGAETAIPMFSESQSNDWLRATLALRDLSLPKG